MWRASIVLAAAVAASAVEASCEIGGVSIGNGVRFITGSHGVDGSIYAQCIDGKARCYMDNRVRDHNAGEEVSCDDATINASRRKLGVYLSDSVKYWPQGVACYSYGSAFTDAQKSVFQQAMNEYHTKTSIRFVTLSECSTTYGNNPNVCGGCTQAFQIVSKGGPSDCYATLGYAPSQRMDLNFGPSCFGGDGGFRVAVHELGHVLGLIHEHTHPNRAVVVLRDSLTLSADNYIKETHGLTTQYDPSSIMHYGRDTGLCVPLDKTKNYCDIDQTAADGCVEPTVSMCDASADNSFGRGPSLSTTDLATLARMYGSGGAATPAPAPVPATTAPAPATPAPTTAPAPVPVPPTETPAPADVPTITPAPVPAPAPAPAPETQPTEAPATPEPAPTPSPTDDNFKQQGDADSQQGGEADNSFHQWQAGGSDEVAGEATEGLSLGQGMAGQVSAPEEPRSADASPKQIVIPPQAQPAPVPVAVPQPLPAADAGPKSQATTPLKPTRPKGKLCQ